MVGSLIESSYEQHGGFPAEFANPLDTPLAPGVCNTRQAQLRLCIAALGLAILLDLSVLPGRVTLAATQNVQVSPQRTDFRVLLVRNTTEHVQGIGEMSVLGEVHGKYQGSARVAKRCGFHQAGSPCVRIGGNQRETAPELSLGPRKPEE